MVETRLEYGEDIPFQRLPSPLSSSPLGRQSCPPARSTPNLPSKCHWNTTTTPRRTRFTDAIPPEHVLRTPDASSSLHLSSPHASTDAISSFHGRNVTPEREPLSPMSVLPTGCSKVLRLGRSSRACTHVLSRFDKAVSRVHAVVFSMAERMVIECQGWNGMVVYDGTGKHVYRMKKNDRIVLTRPQNNACPLIDVFGHRVLLGWPPAERESVSVQTVPEPSSPLAEAIAAEDDPSNPFFDSPDATRIACPAPTSLPPMSVSISPRSRHQSPLFEPMLPSSPPSPEPSRFRRRMSSLVLRIDTENPSAPLLQGSANFPDETRAPSATPNPLSFSVEALLALSMAANATGEGDEDSNSSMRTPGTAIFPPTSLPPAVDFFETDVTKKPEAPIFVRHDSIDKAARPTIHPNDLVNSDDAAIEQHTRPQQTAQLNAQLSTIPMPMESPKQQKPDIGRTLTQLEDELLLPKKRSSGETSAADSDDSSHEVKENALPTDLFLDILLDELALSSTATTPLPELAHLFPPSFKLEQIQDQLRSLAQKHPFLVEVKRYGRDASNRPLWGEWLYDPELDEDEERRNRYIPLMRPVRSARRSHKQYYWKRPRTPSRSSTASKRRRS
ncbi:hypothetical protein SJAG_04512 [Schizosaccharomyces japonicus yFS275]|uniref:FHA domain-containing protein n=1 Tax=Schizosaccharomyces japonicus (strain yFS275 / FY16936) TaxID=402676 RepID=B6K709_SCHJY|nr:hypothetical protein SJAG_04512 [Schizosaccharomyces japonicus yFS275]EEB09313.1 hypothetical protein SJAG_04512 [Schizosaccharomyces japonicus yFS275]